MARRQRRMEAVQRIKEHGFSVVQASRNLDVGENNLRRWIKGLTSKPGPAFDGQGQVKPAVKRRLYRMTVLLPNELQPVHCCVVH